MLQRKIRTAIKEAWAVVGIVAILIVLILAFRPLSVVVAITYIFLALLRMRDEMKRTTWVVVSVTVVLVTLMSVYRML